MNRWNIPEDLERQVLQRDTHCVYCRNELKRPPHPRGACGSWEHIDNEDWDPPTPGNIARCCGTCNTSKGTRRLLDWFNSDYCKKNNINEETVSPFVRNWLKARAGL
jgi:hypothetical protein